MPIRQTGTEKNAAKDGKPKERLQLEFSPEAMQRLDDIKDMSGAATRAEMIRNAIRLYGWFMSETKRDSVIKIIDDGEVTSAFRASLLHDMMGTK